MAQRIRPAGRDLALLGALLPVDDDAGVRVGAGAARASPTGSATLLACAFMAVGASVVGHQVHAGKAAAGRCQKIFLLLPVEAVKTT
jgi:hypothetical protein